MELIDRLKSKAEAGVSNPSEVTTERLNTALIEADDLIGNKIISDTVRLDIANFRLMLMIKKDNVDEFEMELYDKAIKIVRTAPEKSTTSSEVVRTHVKVRQRKSRW